MHTFDFILVLFSFVYAAVTQVALHRGRDHGRRMTSRERDSTRGDW
jgi:hypothetical protein